MGWRPEVILGLVVHLATVNAALAACSQGPAPSAAILSTVDMRAIDHAARNLPVERSNGAPLNVGSVVATDVKLHPVPKAVVGVLAQYAGYAAFRSRTTLVIVDPRSRTIAYMLPLGQAGGVGCPE